MQRRVVMKYAWLLVFFLIVSGCVPANRQSARLEYYTLEYPSPMQAAHPPLPVVLKMKRFSAAPEFRSDRMVYRERDFSRNSYFYNRWRSTPADMVTYFLGRDLREGGLFQAVINPESGIGATHVLEGEVLEFMEQDGVDNWTGRVAVSVTLLVEREPDPARRVLFQKRFAAVERCESRTPGAVARAISGAMARISEEIGLAVHSALKNAE